MTDTEAGCCAQGCKAECRVAQFGLAHPNPQLFYISQWRCYSIVYPVYRLIVAIYFFGWIIYTGTGNGRYATSEANRVKWFIFLTNWGTLLLTTCVMLQAAIALHGYIMYYRLEKDIPTSMTWYLKMEWVWYNVTINSAFLLTVGYWGLLYAANPGPVDDINFHTHAFNSIYVLVDIFITAIPLRLLHFFHGVLYILVYSIFTVIYTLAGGTNSRDKDYIYSILDWKREPGYATLYIVIFTLVAYPVVWLIQNGLYRLRLVFARSCCCPAVGDADSDDNEMNRIDRVEI